MQLWQQFKRLLHPSPFIMDETFSLGNKDNAPSAAEQGPSHLHEAYRTAEGVMVHIDSLLEAAPNGKEALDKVGDLTTSLDENIKRLKTLFRSPTNKDLVMREFQISTQPPVKAALFFIDGLVDASIINGDILQPLMYLAHVDRVGDAQPVAFSIQAVLDRFLPGHQITERYTMASIAEALLAGDTLILFEGSRTSLGMETKKPPTRSVGEPKNEKVVWGPHDAFGEAWRVNVALVRRRLKDPAVVTEILTVGEISKTYIGMMYIDGVVSPKLVAEVKRRIDTIKVDTISGTGILEQYIEDSPNSMLPGTLTTERPDRTAAYLTEGHVALLVDTSPFAMICPITFWSLLQTAEDYYLRHPFGVVLRLLRLSALFIALLLPAFYIAVINFHPEMLPTEFMLFVASTREHVPMPAVIELLAMDFTFELIREAGVRIPGVIGPTMGLVASLILGQAAVAAKVVSPLMIIMIAITGLASFAIPNYLAGFGIRWIRFALVGGGALLGFFGIAMVLYGLIIYTVGMRSFGVPYLSPVAPKRGKVLDILIRPPLYKMELRPGLTQPLNKRRQEEIVRSWDPVTKHLPVDNAPDEGENS